MIYSSWDYFAGYSVVQSSINRPSTLENSSTLCVIKVPLFARTVAAIIMSFGPIMMPFEDKIFLNFPYYSTDEFLSKTAVGYKSKNTSHCLQLCISRKIRFSGYIHFDIFAASEILPDIFFI